MRGETRTPINVSVRISGLDSHGQGYSQTVQTIDVSQHGMRVLHGGLLRREGEQVTVVYGVKRLRFRVVWIGEAGSKLHNQAALAVDSSTHEDVRNLCLPAAISTMPDNPSAAPSKPEADAGEQRQSPRYTCDRGVQIWKLGELTPVFGKLRDLSMTGCFIETPHPFDVNTEVRLVLSLFGMQVRAQGVVRGSLPEKGMGVQFTTVRPADLKLLQSVIGRLAQS